MQRSIRSLALLVLAGALVVGLSGCGDEAGSPVAATSVASSPPPPPPVTTTVADTEFAGLDPRFIADLPFNTADQGSLKVKVQWKSPANHIVLYLAKGGCSFNQLTTNRCDIVAMSESTTPKPRVLTLGSAAAGKYVLWVGNAGPHTETVKILVTLTTGGSTSSESRLDHLEPELIREFTDVIDIQ